MAVKCAFCGRADLMQGGIDKFQCLACGNLTSMETETLVTPQEKPPLLSNAGLLVNELSRGVTVAEPNEYVAPVSPAGDSPTLTATLDALKTPEPSEVLPNEDEAVVPPVM